MVTRCIVACVVHMDVFKNVKAKGSMPTLMPRNNISSAIWNIALKGVHNTSEGKLKGVMDIICDDKLCSSVVHNG